jgi:hypothetical protein
VKFKINILKIFLSANKIFQQRNSRDRDSKNKTRRENYDDKEGRVEENKGNWGKSWVAKYKSSPFSEQTGECLLAFTFRVVEMKHWQNGRMSCFGLP